MPRTGIRFTFALPDPEPARQSEVFRAALDMATHERTSELLAPGTASLVNDLVAVAGIDGVLGLARARLDEGLVAEATGLVDAALAHSPEHPEALSLSLRAHQRLLEDPALEANFWLSGWIEHRIHQLSALEG